MSAHDLKVRVRICVEEDGEEFHAYCPDLKGVHAFGSTPEEAAEHAKDGAIGYLRTLLEHGKPIPLGCEYEEPGIKNVLARLLPWRHTPYRRYEADLRVA